MVHLNLLTDAWIPIRSRDGSLRTIRPAQIAEDLDADAIAWPRADFRIAQLEFLIGLLATVCPPRDEDAWHEGWETPPSVASLDAVFAPYAFAFSLDGDGPRFMQDFAPLQAGVESVEKLLIESPGEQGLKKNTDLLVKRGRAATLSRATAAIALYTLQSWAPAGGAGNRVGLRGGGPLLTLLLPERPTSLWHLLWANVPLGRVPNQADLPRVFPWLTATRVSDKGSVVTPVDAHASQVWWGMPRRIRLVFTEAREPVPCDITGAVDDTQVTGWIQRPYGANYDGWSLAHPLTPYYRMKSTDTAWLPVHPQPGGIGYRHWLGLVLDSDDAMRKRADTVGAWIDQQRPLGAPRLLAAGYDMDNMKARGFVESEMPLPGATDPDERLRIDKRAAAMVKSAEIVAGMTRGAVRAALFSAGATVNLGAETLNAAREKLWEATEEAFFVAIHAVPPDTEDPNPPLSDWHAILRRAAISIFDELAPIAADGSGRPDRVATARRFLLGGLAGYGGDGRDLFAALNLPPAELVAKAKRRRSA